MIVASIILIALGAVLAVMGVKIFKILLPIIGLIAGIMVGFSGVQAVFGKGAVSLAIAIIVAVIVGVIMALLSFFFFEIAVIILTAILFGSMMTYLATAFGLSENGFLTFLMGFAGVVLGLVIATQMPISGSVVLVFTSFFGIMMVFAGIMLVAGSISLDQLHEDGILQTVSANVNNRFVWFIAWFGGSLVAMRVQAAAITREFMDNRYAYIEKDYTK